MRRGLRVLVLVAGLCALTTGSASARVCAVPGCDVAIGLPLELPFSGDRGGLIGTGFTLIDDGSGGGGLLTDHLALDGGALRITTTAGVAFRTANTQDNALGVTLPVRDRAVILETALVAPPHGTGNFEQAGLWFGVSQDDYVKLVLISRGGPRVHLLHETAGNVGRSRYAPIIRTALAELTLRLRIDPVGDKMTAAYVVGDGAPQLMGTWDLPAGLTDAARHSRAGLFATHRLGPEPLDYRFDRFEIRCAAEGCPAGEAPHTPDMGDGTTPVPGDDDGEGEPEPPVDPPVDPPPDDTGTPPAPRPGTGRPAPSRPVTPPPAAGPAAPELEVGVRARIRRHALKRRGLRVRVACSPACSADVDLLARRHGALRSLGRAEAAAAGRVTVGLERRLRRVRRIVVRVQARFPGGTVLTAERRVRVRRAT